MTWYTQEIMVGQLQRENYNKFFTSISLLLGAVWLMIPLWNSNRSGSELGMSTLQHPQYLGGFMT